MFDCMPVQPKSTMSTTLQPTWDEFRRLIAEFLKAADTATLEELEAGAKCCGLAYLGIQWDDVPLGLYRLQVKHKLTVKCRNARK